MRLPGATRRPHLVSAGRRPEEAELRARRSTREPDGNGRRSSGLWLALAGAIASALAIGVGGVLAGDSLPGAGQVAEPAELALVRAAPVPSPRTASAGAPLTRPKPGGRPRARKPRLLYLETDPQTLGPGPTGFRVGNCPRRSKAINGYYFIDGTQAGFGLDAQGDSPIKGLKQWAFYLDGGEGGASNVTFGLICLQNVK